MIINKKSLILLSLLLIVFTFLTIPQDVQAASGDIDYPEGFTILPDCYEDGSCGLNDFIQLFVNLANVMLKILPYLAMIMMIWAGFNLIMSGGNPTKIQEGKKMVFSIVLGVMIVVILAWAWAFFVVIILTGNTADDTIGLIFNDYPWQTEWWGGGEGVIERVPGEGCCIVHGYGCTETGRGGCISMGDIWRTEPPRDPQSEYMGDYQYCFQFATACLRYQVGCCVPKDPDNTTCILPGLEGCLGDATTMTNYQHSNSYCRNIAQCEEVYEAPEIPDIPNPEGCCVTDNSCDMASYLECNGDFHEGAPTCQAVDECNTGCCVYDIDCRASKVNCDSYDGQWHDDVCANVGCDTGCCITNDSCYSSTEGNCNITNDPDFQSFSSGSDCISIPQCLSGCCIDTCQYGRMNCDGLRYDPIPADCSTEGECLTGCCLVEGNVECIDDVRGSDCEPYPPNQFWSGDLCSSLADCYDTGCCRTTNSPYVCHDDYSRGGCAGLGGTFYLNTICSPVVDECRTNGCCVTPDAGDPDYLCYPGTVGVNKAYCESAEIGGTFENTTCDHAARQGECYP